MSWSIDGVPLESDGPVQDWSEVDPATLPVVSENPDNPVLVPYPLDLPPIPDEAVEAALDSLSGLDVTSSEVRGALTDALPFLYDAALRHAAGAIAPGFPTAARAVRSLADEAAR